LLISEGHDVDSYTLREIRIYADSLSRRKQKEFKQRVLEVVYGIAVAFGDEKAKIAVFEEENKTDIEELIQCLNNS